MPALIALAMVGRCDSAVSTMTGVVSPPSRILASMAGPSMFGIVMSRTMRSNRHSASVERPSTPSRASATWKPRRSMSLTTSARMLGVSSTTRTEGMASYFDFKTHAMHHPGFIQGGTRQLDRRFTNHRVDIAPGGPRRRVPRTVNRRLSGCSASRCARAHPRRQLGLDLPEVGEVAEEAGDALHQGQAVRAHGGVLRHDQDLVEEAIDGRLQLRHGPEDAGVVPARPEPGDLALDPRDLGGEVPLRLLAEQGGVERRARRRRLLLDVGPALECDRQRDEVGAALHLRERLEPLAGGDHLVEAPGGHRLDEGGGGGL